MSAAIKIPPKIISLNLAALADSQPAPVAGAYPIGKKTAKLAEVYPEPMPAQPDQTTEAVTQVVPTEATVQAAAPAKISILNPNRNLFWPKFEIEDCRTTGAFGFFVVPILTLGHWDHEWYGDVEFEQADFDQIITNFTNRAAGYEPALYVGHPSMLDAGGRPAAGFLEVLVQNEDVLWGVFAAVNEQVYMDTKKGIYRYSSAELTGNSIHRQTREELGIVLTGCALTNEPFLTNMPAVQVFSQPDSKKCTQTPTTIAYAINHNSCTQDNRAEPLSLLINSMTVSSDPTVTAPAAEQAAAVLTPTLTPAVPTAIATPVPVAVVAPAVAAPVAATPTTNQFSNPDLSLLSVSLNAVTAELGQMKTQFAAMNTQVVQLQAENNALKAARAEDTLQAQLSVVQNSALSAASKLAFSTALSTVGLNPASAQKLMDQVQALSGAEAETYLSQHGATGTVDLAADAAAAAAATAAAAPAAPVSAYASFLSNRATRK